MQNIVLGEDKEEESKGGRQGGREAGREGGRERPPTGSRGQPVQKLMNLRLCSTGSSANT